MPEAAPAPLRAAYATFWPRAGAYVIDYILSGAVAFVTLIAIVFVFFIATAATGDIVLEEDDETVVNIAMVIGFVAASIAGALYFWLGNAWGATAGKRLLGMRVVDARQGESIGLGRGFVRLIVSVLGAVPLCVGWLWCIQDDKKQAWHDKAAGSVVVARGSVAEGDRGDQRWRAAAAVAATVLLVVGVVAGVVSALVVGRNAAERLPGQLLNAGDCLDLTGDGHERVDCSEPHHAEVVAVLEMPEGDGSYPGEDALDGYGAQNCPPETDYHTIPSDGTWGIGDRQIACAATR